jgi:peroxiredoxin Q/BCP
MKRRSVAVMLALLAAAGVARATLDVGEKAPDFTAAAALAGKPFSYSLSQSLGRGPVVVYFFPAAFSDGCSIEAHEFAEAMPKFEALGASVIGVSTDEIEVLSRFSVLACQGSFPVASDAGMGIIKAYDAAMATRPEYANRVSYVIAPNGVVLTSYKSLNPAKHVDKMLEALRLWQDAKAKPKP